MSKIRITLVALGVAAAVASVPALAVTGAADDERYTVAKEITIKPGHDTGWETRLGRTVVIVKHGTLTSRAAPTRRTRRTSTPPARRSSTPGSTASLSGATKASPRSCSSSPTSTSAWRTPDQAQLTPTDQSLEARKGSS